MARSPGSLIPSGAGQPASEKRDDKASTSRRGGKANARAATQVNAVAASSPPPTSIPIQLELFSGRACPLEAKPATSRVKTAASQVATCRDGVQGGGTCGQFSKITGETRVGLGAETPTSREAYKGNPRSRRNEAPTGVGGGHSTVEPRDNRGEGRTATSIMRTKKGKATGLPPRGKAQPRSTARKAQPAQRMETARKLQRTLYRVAKPQLRRMPPEEDGRRAGCGKSASPVR